MFLSDNQAGKWDLLHRKPGPHCSTSRVLTTGIPKGLISRNSRAGQLHLEGSVWKINVPVSQRGSYCQGSAAPCRKGSQGSPLTGSHRIQHSQVFSGIHPQGPGSIHRCRRRWSQPGLSSSKGPRWIQRRHSHYRAQRGGSELDLESIPKPWTRCGQCPGGDEEDEPALTPARTKGWDDPRLFGMFFPKALWDVFPKAI